MVSVEHILFTFYIRDENSKKIVGVVRFLLWNTKKEDIDIDPTAGIKINL